jgi:alkylation response protein AidB-like acyl-CoA dehydrogenase
MFAEAIEAVLQDHCTPQAVRAIEAGGSAAALATALEESGFAALLAPEEHGGAAAGWPEFHEVVALCGAHALPLPLPQTMAARALVRSPDALPRGLVTFASTLVRGADGSLQADLVPFARTASHVIGAVGDSLVLLPVASARVQPTGVHGSLTASLRWEAGEGAPLDTSATPRRLLALAAVVHASLLTGAMKKVFDLTMTYANERVQFGKPIGKFQAIQHQLSVMAEHVAAANIAAEAAFHTGEDGVPALAACATAKARASEAAQLVATTAHAVHGAIGVTEEYDLQLFTRRLHEWRMAHGSESYWHRELGRLYVASGEALVADFAREVFESGKTA